MFARGHTDEECIDNDRYGDPKLHWMIDLLLLAGVFVVRISHNNP